MLRFLKNDRIKNNHYIFLKKLKHISLNLTHFLKYSFIGIFNTAIHWGCFFCFFYFTGNQSTSNLIAFLVAVTFSYFANAKLNFKVELNIFRYLIFICFLALISFLIGLGSDHFSINPFLMLISFSLISLIFGFLFSKWYVFK